MESGLQWSRSLVADSVSSLSSTFWQPQRFQFYTEITSLYLISFDCVHVFHTKGAWLNFSQPWTVKNLGIITEKVLLNIHFRYNHWPEDACQLWSAHCCLLLWVSAGSRRLLVQWRLCLERWPVWTQRYRILTSANTLNECVMQAYHQMDWRWR